MQLFKKLSCFILCFSVFLLCATSAAAAEKKDPQIDRLQNQVRELNNQIKEQKKESENLKKKMGEQQERIDTLQENIGRVYKQAISDTGVIEKYKLGTEAYLRSSYYSLNREDQLPGSGKGYDNAFVNYLDLKFSAKPSSELRFHTTLTMYKLWGTWNSPQAVGSADFNYSEKPSDAGIRVKRAYVDYRPDWLGRYVDLTFGRLPTSDGYLTKYRYNRPSQTNYPDLAFNAESDGVGLTFYSDIPWIQSLNLVYSRSQDETDMNPFQQDTYKLKDINFYVAQLNVKPTILKNSTLVFQWFRVDNIRATADDLWRAYLANAEMIYNLQHPAAPVDVNYRFPKDYGYLNKYTVQFDVERAFGLPVDFFISGALSQSRPNHRQVQIVDSKGKVVNPSTLPDELKPYAQAVSQNQYLVSADNQKSHSGSAIYAGLRYHIDSKLLRHPKIGLEYFKGSHYWVGLDIAGLDPYQKLNTRGTVWEVYYIQPLVEKKFQVRFGYQHISRDYTDTLMAGLYGEPQKTDEKDSLVYASLEFMF